MVDNKSKTLNASVIATSVVMKMTLFFFLVLLAPPSKAESYFVISNGVISSIHDTEAAARDAAIFQKKSLPDEYVAMARHDGMIEVTPDATTPPPPEQTPAPAPGPVGFCFSSKTLVQVENTGLVPMSNLRLGDKVLAGNGRFERVYSFGHYAPDSADSAEYLQLHFASTNSSISPFPPLELTRDHMVFLANGAVISAGMVQRGDELKLRLHPHDVQQTAGMVVTDIQTVHRRSAYAPFTMSGSIVVNGGIVASNYVALNGILSGLQSQWIAHVFQSPHRMYCMWNDACRHETYTQGGVSIWVQHPWKMAQWWMQQRAVVQWMVLALLIPTVLLFALLERTLICLSSFLNSGSTGTCLFLLVAGVISMNTAGWWRCSARSGTGQQGKSSLLSIGIILPKKC